MFFLVPRSRSPRAWRRLQQLRLLQARNAAFDVKCPTWRNGCRTGRETWLPVGDNQGISHGIERLWCSLSLWANPHTNKPPNVLFGCNAPRVLGVATGRICRCSSQVVFRDGRSSSGRNRGEHWGLRSWDLQEAQSSPLCLWMLTACESIGISSSSRGPLQ